MAMTRKETCHRYYLKHREEIAERCRKYRQKNKEKIAKYWSGRKDRQREIKRESARRNSEQINRKRLLRRYGLDHEGYENLLKIQGGVCAICGTSEPIVGRRFHVDHDHETRLVRGLLCHKCNTGLGFFDDDVRKLIKAISYLEKEKDNSACA